MSRRIATGVIRVHQRSRSVAALPGPLSLGHLSSALVALRRRGGERYGPGTLSAADAAGTEKGSFFIHFEVNKK